MAAPTKQQSVRFTKMHSLGNDFAVVELLTQEHRFDAAQIRSLADRRRGIGFDQLLLITAPRSHDCDLYVQVHNSDGGEVEQCGNGLRCVVRLVIDRRLVANGSLRLETRAGVRQALAEEDRRIRLSMGAPLFAPPQIPIEAPQQAAHYRLPLQDGPVEVGAVSLGNPHAVLQVEDVATAEVARLGAAIGKHPCFPQRANVGFMQLLDEARIALRVYERGAGETPACGSGACAAVALGRARGLLAERVEVSLPGGALWVSWAGGDAEMWLSGPATTVYDGEIFCDGRRDP